MTQLDLEKEKLIEAELERIQEEAQKAVVESEIANRIHEALRKKPGYQYS